MKRRRSSARPRALLALAVLLGALVIALTVPVRLGLDLRGGTQIVLETRPAPGAGNTREATDRTVEVLRGRIDSLGVAEPTLVRSGDDRIIVELPGVQEPKEAADLLGRTAQLTVHPVAGASASGLRAAEDAAPPGHRVLPDESGERLLLKPEALDGKDVEGADAVFEQEGGTGWHVTVDFTAAGRAGWQDVTAEAACHPPGTPERRVAIVLDKKIISSPQVDPSVKCGTGITGGATRITGSFDDSEARELALLVSGGALPVPVETVEQRTVGATLGDSAVAAAAGAAVLGTVLTALFVTAVYRFMGFLAVVALGCYALVSYAALAALGATLTLPGLAGFVLAIGMAVDANVLVFERAREEHSARVRPRACPADQADAATQFRKLLVSGVGCVQMQGGGVSRRGASAIDDNAAGVRARPRDRGRIRRAGHSPRSALRSGFRGAFAAIADSNITTLIAAGLLFAFTSGPVRGFGITLGIGVLASVFSALVVTRVLTEYAAGRPAIHRRPWLTGIAHTGYVRERLLRRSPRLLRRPRRWLAASCVLLAVAASGIAVRGLDLGVEFTGGRALEYTTGAPVDPERARGLLADAGYSRVLVQSSGPDGLAVRAGELTDAEVADVGRVLGTLDGEVRKVRDELIGPSLSDELRRNALIALVLALGAQLAYLAVRFRWTFGTAAVGALAHDVVLLVGIFAWLGKPIDGIFLAAVLTVVGYSVNDSVVLFDRIRELLARDRRTSRSAAANAAILQTLPRTVNTGIGVALVLAVLALLADGSLADFALALIIGLTVGTYSSVFTATPLALVLPSDRDRSAPRRRAAEREGSVSSSVPEGRSAPDRKARA